MDKHLKPTPVILPADVEYNNSISRNMIIALLPAMIMAVIFLGMNSLKIMATAVLSCLFFTFLLQKYRLRFFGTPESVRYGPAIVTGILLAFNLPAGLSFWLVLPGSLIALLLGRISIGKRGYHMFNAILVSRLMLRIFFPVEMTTWQAVLTSTDSANGLTPLGILQEGAKNARPISRILSGPEFPGYLDIFWGNVCGPIGEISAIALLMGGLYLIAKKIITWHTPAAILGSLFVFESICWIAAPDRFMDPLFHLISGSTMLVAFFLATDPQTSPETPMGKILAGTCIGLIVIIIRSFSVHPDEAFVAILIVNGMTPLVGKISVQKLKEMKRSFYPK